ncbi:alpha/beta hydrolase family esterase [Streptomyces sp.]|uniref:extracellular catalytic domain type 1 short-chain-length polyhydroxyalkanoate depolymerase n=1 Tax=Streptomyces sp. TaxID=1931 RepID=UPI002F40C93F
MPLTSAGFRHPAANPGRTATPARTASAGRTGSQSPTGSLRRAATTAVLGVLTLLAGLLGVFATPASAAGLTQVTSFGANPGNLAMYEYAPAGLPANAPLVVALHGCTQSANDYFTHSGWQKYADLWKFALVFPQTSSANNPLSCFSWFDAAKDTRGKGEAASVVSMVNTAVAQYGSDRGRVYVTGLSAGGGMTADLLADYPDVFAAGSINSGLPAQCAVTQSEASRCQNSSLGLTPQQWGDKVRNSFPGYTGPWPRVAIWQGTSDFTVYPVNATELRDQWTNVWGISQTPSSTQSLPANTTLSIYNDSTGKPAVEVFSISGMGHGLAVDPGTATSQCGATGPYYLDTICSTYYTARFWGLDAGAPGGGTDPALCYTDNNYNHVAAGRAHQTGGIAYANGSNQNMGLWNTAVVHTLKQTSPDYYVLADSGC